jgi:hypothetical protein
MIIIMARVAPARKSFLTAAKLKSKTKPRKTKKLICPWAKANLTGNSWRASRPRNILHFTGYILDLRSRWRAKKKETRERVVQIMRAISTGRREKGIITNKKAGGYTWGVTARKGLWPARKKLVAARYMEKSRRVEE